MQEETCLRLPASSEASKQATEKARQQQTSSELSLSIQTRDARETEEENALAHREGDKHKNESIRDIPTTYNRPQQMTRDCGRSHERRSATFRLRRIDRNK